MVEKDITERKALESSLRESEERFRLAFDHSAIGMALLDDQGRFLHANRSLQEMFGYSIEELRALSFREITCPEDLAVGVGVFEDLRAGRRAAATFEKRYLAKDGRVVWGRLAVAAVREAGGGLKGLVSQIEDITAHKEAEQALRASEAQFRHLFEISLDAVFLTEPGGEIFRANPAACDLFGYTEEEFRQRGRSALLPDLWPGTAAALALRRSTGRFQGELTFQRKDGTSLPTAVASRIYRDAGGREVSYIAARDLTERRQMEDELREKQARLRALSRHLGQVEEKERKLLARELHDRVGQNLTALGINLNILKTTLSPEADAGVLGRIEDSLAMVDETGKQIRDVMYTLRPSVLDDYGLRAALRWVAERFEQRSRIRTTVAGAEFEPRLGTEPEGVVFRVVQEALNNAAKHANARRVWIELADAGDVCRVVVRDDGVGFDPAEVGARPGDSRWGLSIMTERMQSVDGRLEIRSQPGAGCAVELGVHRGPSRRTAEEGGG